ncbi:hypothetical protein [Peribacillus asahii]|uniref:hypothetical protein n=1 Tax=Peribacillus asahii TaxID=228899 RepID=UPI003815F96C
MSDNVREIFREEIERALTDVLQQKQLPPILTRGEAMEVLKCGPTKMSELMARSDFPVNREFGIKIPTHMLMKWIEKNTSWMEQNTSYFDKEVI